MGEFLNAVSAVFVIFSLMAVGILLGKLKFMTATEKKFVSRYVINIAVPLNTIVGIQKNLKRSDMLEMGLLLLVPLITIPICLAVSILVAKMLKLPKRRSGVFVALAFLSNTLFIGLPMAQELFGDVSLPYVMIYYMCSTVFTQTVALMLVERSGESAEQTGKKQNLLVSLFTKPPILGIIAAYVLLLLDIRLPRIAMSFMNYVSATVTPLALFYCGFVIYELGKKSLRLERGIPAMLALRLLFAPLVSILVTRALGVTGLPQKVFLIEAALPSVSQITVMAGAYGADEQYAAIGSVLSTIGIFITVPILMVLF